MFSIKLVVIKYNAPARKILIKYIYIIFLMVYKILLYLKAITDITKENKMLIIISRCKFY